MIDKIAAATRVYKVKAGVEKRKKKKKRKKKEKGKEKAKMEGPLPAHTINVV